MAKRDKDPRLQKLFDEGKKVYSISKLNTIEQCCYQAYLTYKKPREGSQNVYGIMGNRVHDTLEEIIKDKATEKDLKPALYLELQDLDMLGIDFPKDRKGGTSIRDNWIADMQHFCENFVRPKGKFTTEELFIYKINDDRYIQGYIDLVRHNKDDTISILDWKTSSQFSKDDLIHHGRQLILYAMGKEQEGFKVKSLAWIMLKYVEVTFMGKARSNSKEKTKLVKVFNRGKLLKELSKYIENDLCELNYDEVDIEIMIKNAIDTNSFDRLPKEIIKKYIVKPYVRKYDLTDALRNETLDYINNMADLFESKSDEEEDWEAVEITEKNNFFCNQLCNHKKTCKYLKKYNDMRMLLKSEDEDLF